MNDHDQVLQWLNLGREDFVAATELLSINSQSLGVICFLSQQASEKHLKAYLIEKGLQVPRTHDLRKLCKLCIKEDKTFSALKKPCIRLITYAVEIRYPNKWNLLKSDAIKATEDAKSILSLVCSNLTHP